MSPHIFHRHLSKPCFRFVRFLSLRPFGEDDGSSDGVFPSIPPIDRCLLPLSHLQAEWRKEKVPVKAPLHPAQNPKSGRFHQTKSIFSPNPLPNFLYGRSPALDLAALRFLKVIPFVLLLPGFFP